MHRTHAMFCTAQTARRACMRVCMCVCARPRALTGCCHHQLQGSESLHKRKSVWTQEEDALLRDAYMRVSAEYEDPIPWLHVAQLVPTRTSKQVCVCTVPCAQCGRGAHPQARFLGTSHV
ncbi:hypothetical protein EON66_12360 [archaeon]|nr:MAG: hypothetical protein EON66_12360 [archaeon]